MNILNKIKKQWNFSKSVEQNAIYFNTRENAEKKARKKMLFLALFVLALATFFHNPLLGLAIMIGSISYGSEYVFNSVLTSYISVSALDSTHFVIVYDDNSSSGNSIIGTVSGSTISYGSEYEFNAVAVIHISVSALDSTHFVVSYRDSGGDGYGHCKIGTVSGSAISYGSEYVFNSSSTYNTFVEALDSTHFVVGYRDAGNSNYGTGIIGTVSGSAISYGSEYVFNSASTEFISISALDSTHFVVSYRDNGGDTYGHCKIGTVSGSTISYGSEYVFNSAATNYLSVSALDSTHFVVSYRDNGGDTYGHCKIGTVSGSTISYGSEYVFNSAATYWTSVSIIDSTHFVVAYQDNGNSSYGTAIIGTVSGSTISYGSEYVFNSAATHQIYASVLDSTHFVVGYMDAGNSNYGTAIIGELPSGTDYFKTLSETIAINDTLLNKTSKVFSEVLSIIDSVSVQKTLKRTLSETITIVDNIDAKKIATKTLSETISIVDTIKINISKVFSETISIVDNLSIQKTLKRTLSETISIVDSIEKSIIKFKTLVENISIVDSITKKTSRVFTETVTIVGTLSKQLIKIKIFSEAITITDSVSRKIGKTFTEAISIIPSFAAQTYKVARATIKYTGQVFSKLKNTENIKAKIKKIINN